MAEYYKVRGKWVEKKEPKPRKKRRRKYKFKKPEPEPRYVPVYNFLVRYDTNLDIIEIPERVGVCRLDKSIIEVEPGVYEKWVSAEKPGQAATQAEQLIKLALMCDDETILRN